MFTSKINSGKQWLAINNDKLTIVNDSSDALLFNINLKNQRRVNDKYYYDCAISHHEHHLQFDQVNGFIITNKISYFTIIADKNDIYNNGQFIITNDRGLYVKLETDIISTNDLSQASPFILAWLGIVELKRIITIFLRARYFIDHKKIINNSDQANEVKQIYNDIGQIIIKNIAGNRKESIFYRDQSGHFMPRMQKAMTPQERFDYSYAPSVLLDDYRHMYPPFAIPPSTLVDRLANDGVDYQRAATDESSDAALAAMSKNSFDNSIDAGIIRQAEKALGAIAPQIGAWQRIRAAVDPIGNINNIWPCVLIISGDNIGVNLQHPIFSGALTSADPLFLQGPDDMYSSDIVITGVCIRKYSDIKTDISDVYDGGEKSESSESFNNSHVDHMCPVGIGDTRISLIQLLMLILIIAIIVIAMRPEKNISNIGNIETIQ